MQTKKMILLR